MEKSNLNTSVTLLTPSSATVRSVSACTVSGMLRALRIPLYPHQSSDSCFFSFYLPGAPFQYAALFHKTSVRMHKGCDPTYLDFYSTHRKHSEHDVPCKVSCRNCRSPLMDEGRNMIMAYPSSFNFPDGHVPASFAPSCHIFYKEAIIEVDDGVPKWSGHKDLSELMPHASGSHGKLGKGRSGQEKRGELGSDQNLPASARDEEEKSKSSKDQDEDEASRGVQEKVEMEHDDDYFYSSSPKQAKKNNDKQPQSAAGHTKKRKFEENGANANGDSGANGRSATNGANGA